MSALEDASRRLNAAIDRLDAAVAAHAGERAEMQAALDEVRAENDRLNALTAQVSERLEVTIARLRNVLED